MKPGFRRVGFSLIELILVLGLIGILLGLLLSAVQRARESASRVACQNNLKQVGLGLQLYHDIFGKLPPQPIGANVWDPNRLVSWRVLILPQIDQEPLWAITVAACEADPANRVTFQDPPHVGNTTVVKTFICPADNRLADVHQGPTGALAAYSSYAGVLGSFYGNGVLGLTPGISFSSIIDGLSNTVMVGERPPSNDYQFGRWYPMGWPDDAIGTDAFSNPGGDECMGPFYFGPGRPDNTCDQFHFWSLHTGGANFAIADGSVRFISYSARPILGALATRNGGETVQMPD